MKLLAPYLLAGLCFGLGFFLNINWLLGIVGVFVFLLALERTKSLRQMMLGAYLTWFISLAFSVSIFWSVYPIEWIDLGLGKLEILVVGGQWLVTALVLASGGIVFSLLYWPITKYAKAQYGFILFPLVWILSEVSQSFIYSIFALGPGGSVNIFNSVGYLGYLIGNNEALLQLANWGGVYILSAVGALLGYSLWCLFKKVPLSRFRFIGVSLIVILLTLETIVSFSAKSHPTPIHNKTVAVIDTSFGGAEFYQIADLASYQIKQINEAIKTALMTEADFIILPEDTGLTPVGESAEMFYRKFRFVNGDPVVTVIDNSKARTKQGEGVMRAFIYDGIGKKVWEVDKQYLAPVGEYLPHTYDKVLRSVGFEEQVNKLNIMLSLRPGPNASQTTVPAYQPGILFCFEALNPISVRRLLQDRDMDFIAHPISHAWFNNSKLLERHLDMMLRIQALWNDVTIISAGNMVEGKVYNKDGTIFKPEVIKSGEYWRLKLVSI